MFPLVETIKIFNGIPQNLYWHQLRLDNSFQKLFGMKSKLKISECLLIPDNYKKGLVKARFLYNKESFNCEFTNYTMPRINSIKLVTDDEIEYSLKFTDRDNINKLLLLKEDCDDILIIKNGRVTDTSTANIVFYDGNNWITPAKPLLKGTSRERLLHEGKIIAKEIMTDDISSFSHFKLINAMNDFDLQTNLDVSIIK